jgi:hypothetical protein
MNTSTHEPLDCMSAKLIRCGLPADYAHRAADELADHHRDLVEELQSAGWTETHAAVEASRRLGEPRELVKRTVREYQQRYWCGRWPLATFLLAPIPMLLLVWIMSGLILFGVGRAAAMLIDENTAKALEPLGQYVVGYSVKVWITLASPMLVMAAFCWLAARVAMNRAWPCVASGMMAMFIGFVPCTIRFKTAENPTGRFMIGYDPWFLPENFNSHLLKFFADDMWQLGQLILPLLVTAGCLMYFRLRAGARIQLSANVR